MMTGFFEKDELENIPEQNTKVKRKKIYEQSTVKLDCSTCKLETKCQSPKLEVFGKGKKRILVIMGKPTKREDENGVYSKNLSDTYLTEALLNVGIDPNRDCWRTSAITCYTPGIPKSPSIGACRVNILKQIKELKPHLIIAVGMEAYSSILQHRLSGRIKKTSFSDFNNRIVPDQDLGAWVLYIEKSLFISDLPSHKSSTRKLWENSIGRIPEILDTEFPIYTTEDKRKWTEDVEEAKKYIKKMLKLDKCSIDYETTGKKPHRKGHEIISASISDGEYGYAFPMFKDGEFLKLFKKLLKSKRVGKITHNLKYEHQWSMKILNTNIQNHYWDTMITAHSIHNRQKVSLKIQVYYEFGILGFDKDVDYYLTTPAEGEDKKSDNAFNRIRECKLKDLLPYGCDDALLTYWLYEKQKDQIDKFLDKGRVLFTKGAEKLSEIQNVGICINEELMEEKKKWITQYIKEQEDVIANSESIKKWNKVKNKSFLYTSNKDLPELLFEVLGYKSEKKTPKGKPSTDAETLSKLYDKYKDPFIKALLNISKWSAAKSRYIAQFEREIVDGKIHPNFNLELVDTYRSSSSGPNFQNIPKREYDIKKAIRSFIVPSPGNRLIEYDYKSAEVMISSCYNKDPNLLIYNRDSSTDMHRDCASDLFLKEHDQIDKKTERNEVKNKFVFPAFYGSYYAQMAPDLWEAITDETKDHLRSKGIKNFNSFERHVQKVEDIFWNTRFKVYTQYKKDQVKKYNKRLFVPLKTGFRCRAPLDRKQVSNYPIQGAAFHCLLYALIHCQEEMSQFEKSRIIGQIHDAIVADVHPSEEEAFDRMIWKYATQQIREEWKWIIVPLQLEKERSEIDGTWAEMEDCGFVQF
jgi:uracil-DNA glycosylase family 4